MINRMTRSRGVCLLVILAAASTAAYSTQLYYFDERCNGLGVVVDHAARIRLTRFTSSTLNRNWNCALSVSASSPSDRLMLYFRNLHTEYSSDCHTNRLDIQDSDGRFLTGPTGLCGYITPSRVYTTSGNSAVVMFKTDPFSQYGDFDILVTAFHLSTNATSCPLVSDFRCGNGRCIWSGLTCDGYNNCGDHSDERDGCSLAGGVIAGIVVTIFIVGGIVVLLLIVCRRRRRRTYVRIETQRPGYAATTTSSHPPPPSGAYPPPAGAYPPPAGAYPPPAGAYPPPAGAYPPPQGTYPQASPKSYQT